MAETTTMAGSLEEATAHFERLMSDDGDWVGVFENHDLGHRALGTRIGLVFEADQWELANVMDTRAPDHEHIGLGWRYILVAKTRDAGEAARWVMHEEEK